MCIALEENDMEYPQEAVQYRGIVLHGFAYESVLAE